MPTNDYSHAKAEEQMKKGEISPSELLKKIIPDANERKQYKIELGYSGSAVNAAKKKYKNVSIFQYELYHRENGKWKKIKWDKKKFFDSKGLNNYAIYGENGIVIVKPYSLGKAERMSVGKPGSATAIPDSTFSSDDSSLSEEMDNVSMGAVWYDIKGYSGNDDAIMKNISFAKLCLLKECYESLGILL